MNNVLADSLGIDQENLPDLTDEWKLINYSHSEDAKANLENDYQYARINIIKAIEKQTQLMDKLTQLVSASPVISDFEILSKYTASLAQLNQDLLDLDEAFIDNDEDENENDVNGDGSQTLTSTQLLRNTKIKA